MSVKASVKGEIVRLVAGKGFGFLRDASGNELFFHHSAVKPPARFDALVEGQAVTFVPGSGPKGPRAEDVQVS
jgi:CspA family cold shock protein